MDRQNIGFFTMYEHLAVWTIFTLMNVGIATTSNIVQTYYNTMKTMVIETIERIRPDAETCVVLAILAVFTITSIFAFYLIYKVRYYMKGRPQRRRGNRNRNRMRNRRRRPRNPRFVNHG